MSLPTRRPLNRIYLAESTTSMASTPVAMIFIAPESGYLREIIGATTGTTTGTITLAVTVNGGSDVTSSGLTIAAGSGYTPSTYTVPLSGVNAVAISPGDVIAVTPSGGTGSSIGGAVTLVIAK